MTADFWLLVADCSFILLSFMSFASIAIALSSFLLLLLFLQPKMDGPTATKEIRELGYRGLILGVTGEFIYY